MPIPCRWLCCLLLLVSVVSSSLSAEGVLRADTTRGDAMIKAYFQTETAKPQEASLAEVKTAADWQQRRESYRGQLCDMLGLEPWPEKTPLEPVVTGKIDHGEFTVENLHFQSRPGLFVTGNLYVPKLLPAKLPAVLYVCGHASVEKEGVRYGNKVSYQHHGGWLARNGYVCLVIDTLVSSEIEGLHHGTYKHGRWWWLNRGYTPAGVEAWNGVRALDYLETRPEVDTDRIGVTGRSGGGATTWWIAAIDPRVKCAIPVAGMTDLHNHIVDGCVAKHCDCMYMVNTYRWEFAKVAALISPRPLLISNTDTDGLFPLDGVMRTFEQVRRIYRLQGAASKIALNITPGGHRDTQELRVTALRWLNKHLKGDDSLIETTAAKFFKPEQLKVFDQLPAESTNASIDESFVARAASRLPADAVEWAEMRAEWRIALREKIFAGWPETPVNLDNDVVFDEVRDGIRLRAVDFTSQRSVRLRLYSAQRAGLPQPQRVVLNVLDAAGWSDFVATMRVGFDEPFADEEVPSASRAAYEVWQTRLHDHDSVLAYVAPRGIGPTAWNQNERNLTHIRRRFHLLGQTLDGMRVWDARRAAQTLRLQAGIGDAPLCLSGRDQMAGVALYASLFEPQIAQLELYRLPEQHRNGPFFLNVSKFLDIPQALAMAAEQSHVTLYDAEVHADAWHYARDVAQRLAWDPQRLSVSKLSAATP